MAFIDIDLAREWERNRSGEHEHVCFSFYFSVQDHHKFFRNYACFHSKSFIILDAMGI